ncbi:MAG: integrase arm-type DNA-binding domain-containing protein [Phyllobacteriaceae bacterium]|nr:integrase arm-type DNA-binding domain-containing protein [Phyllobacteriaceae bacterium]
MATALHKLTDRKVKAVSKPGRISDGGGLYLRVRNVDAKSWAFLYRRGDKWNEIGLGAYADVSLARAREVAGSMRALLAEGRDPKAERDRENEPNFAECVDRFLASMEAGWRNDKHRAQWRMTLGEAYCAAIRPKKVSAISTEDVLNVLTPIWQAKPETASRLRGRIERVLDFAKARGWRMGENAAVWRGHLRNVLPARQKLTRGHHAAMPYGEIPTFIERLRKAEALAARALEFGILTAARSGEVYGARWSEFDLETGVWTVPAERMKAGRPHRVPLSGAALAIVKALHETRISDFVYPGQKAGRSLSSSAMEMLLRRMKADQFTVHGFRSAFRDWAGDETSFPREVAEAALAHSVGDATEAAYRRSDALVKRRALMEAWAGYCEGTMAGKIISLRTGRKR